jgi:hypothetical protein
VRWHKGLLDPFEPSGNLRDVKALPENSQAETEAQPTEMREAQAAYGGASAEDIDISLLEDSLSRSPWERMLANDDALNFAESLRVAVEKRDAKPE